MWTCCGCVLDHRCLDAGVSLRLLDCSYFSIISIQGYSQAWPHAPSNSFYKWYMRILRVVCGIYTTCTDQSDFSICYNYDLNVVIQQSYVDLASLSSASSNDSFTSDGCRIYVRVVPYSYCARSAREILKNNAQFGLNHAHFRSLSREQLTLPSLPFGFRPKFLLRHAKVRYSSSILRPFARSWLKGGSI